MYLYTLREVPAEAEIASHILLLRAGFIRKQVAGVYAYLPLGARTLRKIENIVREEMDAKVVAVSAAFDLAAACSGFSYGYCLAHAMIMSGQAKNVLIVAADLMSRACDPTDRTTIILFGDGASACVLGPSDTEGTIAVHMSADAKYGPLLSMEYPKRGNVMGNDSWLYMKGNDVFKHAVTVLASLVTKTLEKGNMQAEDLDFLVPHQANLRIIAATARKLKMDMSQVIVTLDKQGNTSAPSVGIALDEGIRSGRIKRGDVLLLESFGGGFTWGSALIRY